MDQREHDQSEGQGSPEKRRPPRNEELPYAVELWKFESREIERIVARALNAGVARAIFKAAQDEYPGRRLTLSCGAELLADTAR